MGSDLAYVEPRQQFSPFGWNVEGGGELTAAVPFGAQFGRPLSGSGAEERSASRYNPVGLP